MTEAKELITTEGIMGKQENVRLALSHFTTTLARMDSQLRVFVSVIGKEGEREFFDTASLNISIGEKLFLARRLDMESNGHIADLLQQSTTTVRQPVAPKKSKPA